MTTPDLERARQYALERLERDLPTELLYHSVAHTRDDVLPAALRFAAREGVTGLDLLLLKTAALYHDIGFVTCYLEHERASTDIAREVLPEFGYTPAQIDTIADLIMATHFPQSATSQLERLLADADLDVLGREDFFARNELLRAERAAVAGPVSLPAWYRQQLAFLEEHDYFTAAARALRNPQKRKNIARLRELLHASTSAE